MCSDPTKASVAPHGGAKPVFTPNPMAVGIPTEGDPIMIDISCSITTNNMLIRLAREGKKLPEKWLIDAEGNLTDDPAVWRNGGALLLSGGLDHGQKGYGWILMLEALTQGLSGFGRADGPNNSMSASIYIQIVDPSAFSGRDAFKRQTSHMAEACRATPPLAGIEKVRLPGDSAMRIRRESVKHGVVLHPGTLESLASHAARHGLDLPQPKL
jgi:L-lactate dehydrogenase